MRERFKLGELYGAWCLGVDIARRAHRGLHIEGKLSAWRQTMNAKQYRALRNGHDEMAAALRRGSNTIRSSKPLPQMELDFSCGPATLDDGC